MVGELEEKEKKGVQIPKRRGGPGNETTIYRDWFRFGFPHACNDHTVPYRSKVQRLGAFKKMFCHSPESWTRMREEQILWKGQVNVSAILKESNIVGRWESGSARRGNQILLTCLVRRTIVNEAPLDAKVQNCTFRWVQEIQEYNNRLQVPTQ